MNRKHLNIFLCLTLVISSCKKKDGHPACEQLASYYYYCEVEFEEDEYGSSVETWDESYDEIMTFKADQSFVGLYGIPGGEGAFFSSNECQDLSYSSTYGDGSFWSPNEFDQTLTFTEDFESFVYTVTSPSQAREVDITITGSRIT